MKNRKEIMKKPELATTAIHNSEIHDKDTKAHIAPIYQTSTFTFENFQSIQDYQNGNTGAHMYTRGSHPSRQALAGKIAALESYDLEQNGVAEVFSSGMAAISAALMGLCHAGDHIIAQDVLYGTSEHLIANVLPNYGISHSLVKNMDLSELKTQLKSRPNTTVVYIETPANPTMFLVDIAAVVEIAHSHGAKVIVDNTFATPVLQRPLSLGADIVVHSTTKYINGHGTVIGGAIVAKNALLFEERIAHIIKTIGAVPSPFDCWITNIGLKTLPLRMEKHSQNALEVASFLEQHKNVKAVSYPGLKSHPQHELAKKQMSGFGGMLAFELAGQKEAAIVLNNVRLAALAVSLGNVDTLIEHPASMTHQVVPEEIRLEQGITDGLIRLSVGIEAASDIIKDLDQALNKI